MTEPSLVHHQAPPFLERRDGRLWAELWMRADSPPADVFLRLEPDNEERLVPMEPLGDRGRFRVYRAELTPNPAEDQTVYAFKVLWADRQLWLDAAGTSPRMPLRERFFRICNGAGPPDWVPDQVFYQIFPDRFRNGDPATSPKNGAYNLRDDGPIRAKRWGEPIDSRRPNSELYGGDLVGVVQGLDYLEDLGVTAIYLNPIFTSPSVHKYDTEDYERVDPYLGGNAALAALREATSRRGMRYLLDAVFNHTSDTHPWFNRWGTHPEPGAYQDLSAPYRAAYTFYDSADPESYHCWQGSKVLPVLDFGQPAVQEYFYAGPDAIARRWLRPPYSADGWRIDVAHMMGEGTGARRNHRVLRALRRAIKDESPDAYVLGEHFSEATRWLQGDQEDGAMNYYGFAHPVRAFLAGQDVNYHPIAIDAAGLAAWLTDARSRIPYANQLCQLNLLGSHDTARFLTLVGGDRGLMGLALHLLFAYPGVPCIYYGDEIGMAGANDPHNRACFDWDQAHWDKGLRGLVQSLARLRRGHPALRRGAYRTLLAEGDCLGFARFDEAEMLILVVNRSERSVAVDLDLSALPWLPAKVSDALDEGHARTLEGERLALDLPPKGASLLLGRVDP
jgi:alpha-glucosidase